MAKIILGVKTSDTSEDNTNCSRAALLRRHMPFPTHAQASSTTATLRATGTSEYSGSVSFT